MGQELTYANTGTLLRVALLNAGAAVPPNRTFTTDALASSGATSLSLKADVASYLEAGTILVFGAVSVTVATGVFVALTPTTVAVNAISGGIADELACTPLVPYITLGGSKDFSINKADTVVDSTQYSDAGGQSQRRVSAEYSIDCECFAYSTNAAIKYVIKPSADSLTQFLYAKLTSADGDTHTGPADIRNFSSMEAKEDILRYKFQIVFQGLPTIVRAA